MEQQEAEGELNESDIPGILIDRGWRQGTIIWAPGAQSSYVCRDDAGFVSRPQETPSDGRFVVVSQSCDISAALEKEPVVEAFACAVEPNPVVRANYSKSFRRFEVDPAEGLMAHAAHRVAFDKRALLDLTPDDWPGSSERLRAFARWLGGRASRPAIPDPIVKAFVNPLEEVLRALRKKNSAAFVALNGAVAEILIGLPESELPPFDIPVRLLLAGEVLSIEAADAIAAVETGLQAKLDPAKARLQEFISTNPSRMSVEIYFATVPVELNYLTYDGDEIVGAESYTYSD